MAKNDFSGIRSYSELEATIRMIRRTEKQNHVSQEVSRFKAQGGPKWQDAVLVVIRALKKRLTK